MAYLENNLTKGENIVFKAEVNKLAAVPYYCIGALLILLGLITLFIGGIFFIIVGIIVIAVGSLAVSKTELGLTNKKIMGKYGIINTKVMDSPIGKINSISVEQGLGGKIFGYGKIVISTSSGGYNFKYIKNADSFRSAAMEQIDIYENEKSMKQVEQVAAAMKM